MKPEQNSDTELEKTLRQQLRPNPPEWKTNRAILEAILLQDKSKVDRSRRREWLRFSWIASLGMVAAVVLTAVVFFYDETSSPGDHPSNGGSVVGAGQTAVADADDAMQYMAVGARKNLIGIEDMGWKETEEGNVTREFKYDYIDTVDLVNEEDGSIMRVQVPRQEIVNISYQVI